MTSPSVYRLGLPAWSFPAWRGRYFEDRPSRFASYARVFGTVEGNTTFYRIPDARTVAGWSEALAGTEFRVCFKLPRTVTHERTPALDDLDSFLAAIAPLQPHLGPLLLQFPASVGPARLDAFAPVFERVAACGRFVVEPRHIDFFTCPERLEPVLDRYRAGRAVMDARAIHDGDIEHPEVRAARHEKPDVPVFTGTYHDLAFTRLVLHPDLVSNDGYIDRWAKLTADRLAAGIRNYVTIHCPNNLHCPPLARRFHERLRECTDAATTPAPLPPWPLTGQQSLL